MPTREEVLAKAREKVERAGEVYRLSKAECDRVQRAYGSMLKDPVGAHAIRQAIWQQRRATEEFRAALNELNDLILGRARPSTESQND